MQNITYEQLRNFRRKTNHLKQNSEIFKTLYLEILTTYFTGALILPKHLIKIQCLSLKRFYLELLSINNLPIESNIGNDLYNIRIFYYLRKVVELM